MDELQNLIEAVYSDATLIHAMCETDIKELKRKDKRLAILVSQVVDNMTEIRTNLRLRRARQANA